MIINLDPVFLARIQFAFTISFHIIFPAFTIGLASWLAVLEWRWLKTGNTVYEEVYRMWVKIFAVTFGMGVVSGVVMSFQFGTNWSVFSDRAGNVLGPLLGYEVLTAFFLEASFLGVMLFGWNRVSPKMHFAATIIVAVGTLISAFWILSANSWMQTPQGYRMGADGLLYPTDWIKIIFNPSFPYRFLHMVTASYLTTAFVVGGIGAYYLRRHRHVKHARVMLGMAMIMAVFVAPIQAVMGDFHGLNTLEHQPAKVAAIEGIWETEQGAPLRLFGWPDQEEEKTKYAIEIPKLSSLILTHSLNGEVKGLKEWPKDDRPPVAPVFWSFRVMVGIGVLMIFTGVTAAILFLRKQLFNKPWFQLWCIAMTPAGFATVLAGWFVTEIGRQPYIVYGVIRTAKTISPVMGSQVALSLLAFIFSYVFIFGAGSYYILRLIGKGPG
ncbi:MAG: cytochrome ubiquinol oxidase subunit I, partial [Desulfobacterales bacterium]